MCWLFAKVIEISEEVLGITTIPYNILMHVTHGQFVYLSHSGVQRFVTQLVQSAIIVVSIAQIDLVFSG